MKFVYDAEAGKMVEKTTGKPMVEGDWTPTVPIIIQDNVEYKSPITGELIQGKQHEKRHMKEHGVIHSAEFREKPRRLQNERFVEKHGLQRLAD